MLNLKFVATSTEVIKNLCSTEPKHFKHIGNKFFEKGFALNILQRICHGFVVMGGW